MRAIGRIARRPGQWRFKARHRLDDFKRSTRQKCMQLNQGLRNASYRLYIDRTGIKRLKSGWELKFDDSRSAFSVSGSIVLLTTAFVYSFLWQAGGVFASSFSRKFSMQTDLGACTASFANVIMAQMIYALAISAVLFVILLHLAIDASVDRQNRVAYLKPVLLSLSSLSLLIFCATNDSGFWMPGRYAQSMTLSEACQVSGKLTFVRIYLISACLALSTWLVLAMSLFWRRELVCNRDYHDYPADPAIRAKILAVHAKYPDIFSRAPKPISIAVVMATGMSLLLGLRGIYRLLVIAELV
ncbi:hypothetical protein [Mesorhizobium sp. CN2-181]|uniref:hypothetical protein n=1 Tax=Mesorhizobium yinganensis TaxID=3157707 RepID=UPI0032B85564